MKKNIVPVLLLFFVLQTRVCFSQNTRRPHAGDAASASDGPDTVKNCFPVALSGFNYDVVADGTTNEPKSTVSYSPYKGLDDVDYVFTSEDFNYKGYKPAYFLPSSHTLESKLVKGLTFSLSAYNVNNALLLHGSDNSGTLNFVAPIEGKSVYILGTTGSGDAEVTFTVNYFDGTKYVCEPQTIPDWFRANDIIIGERFYLKENYFCVIYNNPGFSTVKLKTNAAKKIKSITAQTSGEGYCAIMAVSIDK